MAKLFLRGFGLRTVIAGGQRIQYSPEKITGKEILPAGPEGPISKWGKQFVTEEFLYHPAQFQMNTAFSRAYLIERFGSKQGIRRNSLYFDDSFLRLSRGVVPYLIKVNHKKQHIVFTIGKHSLLHVEYDSRFAVGNKHLTSRVIRISKFIVDKGLDADGPVEFPLEPEKIVEIWKQASATPGAAR